MGSGMKQKSGIVLMVSLVTACMLFGTSASVASADADPEHIGVPSRHAIRGADGAFVGTVTFQSSTRGTVLVIVHVSGLTPGFHGLHVHTVGVCDPTTTDSAGNPAPFLSAGLHFNPASGGHGDHAGDLPALLVTSGGRATAIVETDRFTTASLRDADGSAIIVHALPDNLANIPTRYVSSTTGQPGPDAATLATGDSGGRVACGVIARR
jgi:Cu-Zn family superoxide dismutase